MNSVIAAAILAGESRLQGRLVAVSFRFELGAGLWEHAEIHDDALGGEEPVCPEAIHRDEWKHDLALVLKRCELRRRGASWCAVNRKDARLSDGNDADQVLEPREVVGVATVEIQTIRVRRRGDQQIGEPASRLASFMYRSLHPSEHPLAPRDSRCWPLSRLCPSISYDGATPTGGPNAGMTWPSG